MKEMKLKNGQILILREPAIEDAKEMVAYLNIVGGESDNLPFGKDEFGITAEEEEEYIRKISKDPNTRMLVGVVNGIIVCIAQITGLTRKRLSHNSDFSITVRKDYWGLGIGSAAMEELIRFVKEHPVIENVSLGVVASNHNAIYLYEKFGFQRIGIRKNYMKVNGIYEDLILMDLYLEK